MYTSYADVLESYMIEPALEATDNTSRFDFKLMVGCIGRLRDIAQTLSDNNYKLSNSDISKYKRAFDIIGAKFKRYSGSASNYKNEPSITTAVIQKIIKYVQSGMYQKDSSDIQKFYSGGNTTSVSKPMKALLDRIPTLILDLKILYKALEKIANENK